MGSSPNWFTPNFSGDAEPDLLLVCWGSTRGSAIEAANRLRNNGRRVATLHFPQIWPIIGEGFIKKLESAGKTVAVESNATGQFVRLIRRETGFQIEKTILRYDGLPITPEYILAGLPI